MADNRFITPAQVAAMALPVLENNAVFVKGMKREFSDEYAGGADIGYTVNVKKPPRWAVGEGPVIEPQGMVQSYVPITIEKQFHVPASLTSSDYTLSRSDFYDVLQESAIPELANKLDNYALSKCWPAVGNFFAPDGGLGVLDNRTITATNAVNVFGLARQFLTEQAAPQSGRLAVFAPRDVVALTTAYSNLFQAAKGPQRFENGEVGMVSGIETAEDVNVATLTNGTLNATGLTGVAAQGAANSVQADATTPYSLTIQALGGTLAIGQVITIAGVFAVNPLARQSLGRLQTFVVMGNGTLGTPVGAADTTAQIIPYPVFSGPFQNVYSATGAIAGGSVITSVSGLNSAAYTQNLAYHPNAFQFVTARMKTPGGTNSNSGFAYSKKTGLSIRFVRDWYDARTDQFITRFDILAGAKAVYPELAVRISG